MWLALVLLLLASLGSAYLPLGRFNLVAGVGIALVNTALIGRWFMQLHRAGAWSRVAAVTALCALLLLAGLSGFDGATRSDAAAPYQVPQQLPPLRPATR